MKYKYVKVYAEKGVFKGTLFEAHRGIIDDMAEENYRYIGYIPTKIMGYGIMVEMDLVFEKIE